MKLSPAQAALLHTGESAASSALMTLVIGIWQALATGQVHWSQMAVVFGSGFVGALGLIYKSVASSPNLQQAEADTTSQAVVEVKAMAHEALTRIENMWPVLHDLNTRQTAQEAITKAATPVVAQVPVGPANIQPQGPAVFSLPQRTFTQSALMPAVTPTKP